MIEAMQVSLMDEFESQRRAQADSYTSELAVKLRHFNGEWERRLEEASKGWAEEKARLLGELAVAQAAQRRLESRVENQEAVVQDW